MLLLRPLTALFSDEHGIVSAGALIDPLSIRRGVEGLVAWRKQENERGVLPV
jgi:hypothetical protein